MPNQQLIDYIKGEIVKGVSKDQIKATLIQNSWLPTDVDEAFKLIDATPKVFSGAVIDPSLNQPQVQPQFVSQAQSQFQNQNATSIQSPNSSSNKKVIVSLVIVAAVVILGGVGAWAYFKLVPPNPQAVMNKAITNLAIQINQKGLMNVVSNLNVKGDGNIPQNPSGLSTVSLDASANIQSDLNAKKASTGLSFNVVVNAGPMMSVNVDGTNFLDLVTSNNKFYFRLNKIPSGLDSYIAMLGQPDLINFVRSYVVSKWIEVDQDQLSLLNKNGQFQFPTYIPSSQQLSPEQVKTISTALSDANILVVDKTLPDDLINSQSVFHYKVKIDRVALTNFYVKVFNIMNVGQNQSGMTEQSLRASIDQMFTQYDTMIKDGVVMSSDMYIAKDTNMPVKFALTVDLGNYAPAKSSGVHSLTITAGASYDYSTPVNIAEPTNYVTAIDMFARLGMMMQSATTSTITNTKTPVLKR